MRGRGRNELFQPSSGLSPRIAPSRSASQDSRRLFAESIESISEAAAALLAAQFSAVVTMATSSTPPPLHGPTAKEKKYDRQLRLWAAAGQQALEEAHVLLLNGGAGVVGIETLKNLVLPGVGNFTIVDERMVQEEDLGVNFFLEESSLGRSRAEECCKFLQELNPEVKGYAVQEVRFLVVTALSYR